MDSYHDAGGIGAGGGQGTAVMTVPAGACRRAGSAWQFGLPPENGQGQFDA